MLDNVTGQATSVEDTLKDFWATRPRRPRRGRKLAGVAAGIGNRYGIDPIVVRVAFVVATFYGGAGILVYLLGWLLLPEQDDQAAPFESMIHHRRSSTSSAFTVLLCLALIPAFYFLVMDNNRFSGILGLLIVAGALYLLHRSRGHLNRPVATPAPSPAPAAEPFDTPVFGVTEPTYAPPRYGEPSHPAPPEPVPVRPPSWDPLGAAPFAWDLPEPAPPEPEPPAPRKRPKIGLMTFAVALIAAGGLTAAWLAPGGDGGWLTPAHIVGVVLGVIGLGMVGGSFVRSGRGLIGLAVPLSIIGMGLTAIAPHGWHGVGEINERPTSIAEVQDSYERSAGTIDLDLTALPESGDVSTTVSVDAGDVTVIVPANADVDLFCRADIGDINCLGRNDSGPDVEKSIMDHGPDGRGGLSVTLHVEVGAGSVEVRRG